MSREHERRPRDLEAASRAGQPDASIIVDDARTRTSGALAEAFAVVVTTERGSRRRRLYLSLHSASRAVERANRRHDDVQLVLVRLVPVEGAL